MNNHNEQQSIVARRYKATSRIKSIQYAWSGVLYFFSSQRNATVHLVFTLSVVVAGALLNVSRTEAILLAMAMGIVWMAELFNSVIEEIMDHLSPGKHNTVKRIKDMAAAAVMVAAATALVTGAAIFLPKIF